LRTVLCSEAIVRDATPFSLRLHGTGAATKALFLTGLEDASKERHYAGEALPIIGDYS
jgi:hypothetical protein